MKYFGPDALKNLAVHDEMDIAPVPVGIPCAHCEELIIETDCGYLIPHVTLERTEELPWHFSCHLRSIIGSVAHIERRCGCYVEGSSDNDAPELTRREAAIAAVRAFDSRDSGT